MISSKSETQLDGSGNAPVVRNGRFEPLDCLSHSPSSSWQVQLDLIQRPTIAPALRKFRVRVFGEICEELATRIHASPFEMKWPFSAMIDNNSPISISIFI
jgi:hypothetical protein